MCGDRRLRAVLDNKCNQVHGHDERVQHDDERLRPVSDERDLLGREADLRDGDQYVPWLHRCERLFRVLRAHGMRGNGRVRPMHGQHDLFGHHAYLRDRDEYLPKVLRR